MNITNYKILKDSIVQSKHDINSKDWDDTIDWISISAENRSEVANYLNKLNRYSNTICDCIERPEDFPFSNTFDTNFIINFPVSNKRDIYKTDYVSVIVEKKLIITISNQADEYFNDKYISTYSEKKHPTINYFLFHIIISKILTQNNVDMGIARKRLQNIELMFAKIPDKLSSNELMLCEQQVSQLSDIMEDQRVGAGVLASLSSSNLGQEYILQTNKLLKGFEPIEKAMLRLEKKAKSLRLHYILLQQEKSTRKINVLTIVQAIFVPLTFIAGVYGMNFINIPELNWPFGYLFAWLVFIGLAIGLLIYFYRKGWFD